MACLIAEHYEESLVAYVKGLVAENYVHEYTNALLSWPLVVHHIYYTQYCAMALQKGARDILALLCAESPDIVIEYFKMQWLLGMKDLLSVTDLDCWNMMFGILPKKDAAELKTLENFGSKILLLCSDIEDDALVLTARAYSDVICFACDTVFTLLCDDTRCDCGIRNASAKICASIERFIVNNLKKNLCPRARVERDGSIYSHNNVFRSRSFASRSSSHEI